MRVNAGASRVRITPSMDRPRPLLGWGDPRQIARRAATEIHSRAVYWEDPSGGRLVFVSVEVCFISESLRRGVMNRLKSDADLSFLREEEVVLTATHTHSAPGAYCHSILYNVPSKGYSPEVYETYVSGMIHSIREAWAARAPAILRHGAGEIPLREPVAFNRAIEAWNRNRDTEKFSASGRDQALYRVMDVISVRDLSGKPIALISWFAVHCTTLHRDFRAVHSDNKGLAAIQVERHFSERGHEMVALFAQGAAGDVSPNFKKYWFKRDVRGAFRDDEQSCDFNAEIQARYAIGIAENARPVEGSGIDSVLSHHDCTRIPVPPEWVGGQEGLSTGPAALGCPFMGGTAEGGGMSRLGLALFTAALKTAYWIKRRKIRNRYQGVKVICVELTEGKVFGDARPADLPIPSVLDPVIRVMRFWSRLRVFRGETMTPHVLPFQLFRLGNVGFIAGPGEFTTTAGKRIRELLLPVLAARGMDRLIFSGYANSYAGYITTEEEYDIQGYEGACTHFGRYTLLGYMALFRQLAHQWTGSEVPGARIPEVPPPAEKSASYLKKIDSEFFSRRG